MKLQKYYMLRINDNLGDYPHIFELVTESKEQELLTDLLDKYIVGTITDGYLTIYDKPFFKKHWDKMIRLWVDGYAKINGMSYIVIKDFRDIGYIEFYEWCLLLIKENINSDIYKHNLLKHLYKNE